MTLSWQTHQPALRLYSNVMRNDDSLLLPSDDTPARADARRNRELLLQTAQSLFERDGVEAVSMTAIADEAGVGKGTLYRHFASKADLCIALLDEDMRQLQMNVLTYLRENAANPPLENLQWFLQSVLSFVLRNIDTLTVESDSRGLGLDHPAHIWWRQTLAGLLAQAEPDDDVRYRADILFIMLDVRTIRFQQQALNYTEEDIFAGLLDAASRLITPD